MRVVSDGVCVDGGLLTWVGDKQAEQKGASVMWRSWEQESPF